MLERFHRYDQDNFLSPEFEQEFEISDNTGKTDGTEMYGQPEFCGDNGCYLYMDHDSCKDACSKVEIFWGETNKQLGNYKTRQESHAYRKQGSWLLFFFKSKFQLTSPRILQDNSRTEWNYHTSLTRGPLVHDSNGLDAPMWFDSAEGIRL